MPEKKYIRFINSDYQTLFYLPDGGRIRITYPDREPAERVCRFIDEYHTDIGGYHYHICEFAERMEQIGAKYVPLDYVREPEFYEKYYLLATDKSSGPAYYYIDETETHAFAFAPRGAEKGKKFCVVERRLIGDFCKSSIPVQWGGSLQDMRPQDWGFNLAKIKAVTQKPKKRTGPKR